MVCLPIIYVRHTINTEFCFCKKIKVKMEGRGQMHREVGQACSQVAQVKGRFRGPALHPPTQAKVSKAF